MKIFYFFILVFSINCGYAYTNFIGHSYTSCLNCHYNPFGGGPVNDYGRVVAATGISSSAFYPSSVNEEKLAYMSGFLFRKPKQDWLRTQINYRGFQVVRNPGSTEAETKTWINMQFDGRVVLKFGENDKYVAVANYGYSPLPQPAPPGHINEWRSREHYVGYRFSPKFGLYAGLMDKVYGLRVIEHISYNRIVPQLTQNDQTHGVVAHLMGDTWEGGIHGFVGNLDQDPDLRMKGASILYEKTVAEIHRIGFSTMSAKNDYLEQLSYSGHARLNLKEGSAILTELGQTQSKTENGSGDKTARFALFQTYVRPWRGVYLINNVDYLKKDISVNNYTVRWGAGVQYFPLQRLELRFDIYNTRNFDPGSSTLDTWMYLLQTHVWL